MAEFYNPFSGFFGNEERPTTPQADPRAQMNALADPAISPSASLMDTMTDLGYYTPTNTTTGAESLPATAMDSPAMTTSIGGNYAAPLGTPGVSNPASYAQDEMRSSMIDDAPALPAEASSPGFMDSAGKAALSDIAGFASDPFGNNSFMGQTVNNPATFTGGVGNAKGAYNTWANRGQPGMGIASGMSAMALPGIASMIPGGGLFGLLGGALNGMGAYHDLANDPNANKSSLAFDPVTGMLSFGTRAPGGYVYQGGQQNNINTLSGLSPTDTINTGPGGDMTIGQFFDDKLESEDYRETEAGGSSGGGSMGTGGYAGGGEGGYGSPF